MYVYIVCICVDMPFIQPQSCNTCGIWGETITQMHWGRLASYGIRYKCVYVYVDLKVRRYLFVCLKVVLSICPEFILPA